MQNTTGNQSTLMEFAHGSAKYMSGIYKLYLKYKWPQVLEYHFKSHNHHMVKMQDGNYGGWGHADMDLMSLYMFSHPRARQVKQATQSSWTRLKDMSKEFCHAFTYSKFLSLCKSGFIHRCHKCNLLDHRAGTCMRAN